MTEQPSQRVILEVTNYEARMELLEEDRVSYWSELHNQVYVQNVKDVSTLMSGGIAMALTNDEYIEYRTGEDTLTPPIKIISVTIE